MSGYYREYNWGLLAGQIEGRVFSYFDVVNVTGGRIVGKLKVRIWGLRLRSQVSTSKRRVGRTPRQRRTWWGVCLLGGL